MIVSLNYLSKVWDLKTLEQVKVIETQGGSVYSLVVSADYIIVGTYENCIHVRSSWICVFIRLYFSSSPNDHRSCSYNHLLKFDKFTLKHH